MPQPFYPSPNVLTPRQIEVLVLSSKGFTAKEVAERIGIGRFTVLDHLKEIYRRLDVDTKVEAAVWAAKAGLV